MRSWRSLVLVLILALLAGGAARAAGEAEFDRGVKAFEAGQYPIAAAAFGAAVKKDPGEALYHLWHGMALFRAGEVDLARVSFESASRLGGRSEVGESARKNLRALESRTGGRGSSNAASAGSGSTSTASSASEQTPTGWTPVGAVEGLIGTDWHVRDTKYTRAWARKGDLAPLEEVIRTLDQAYLVNSSFMGFQARLPLEFFFFPLSDPAHTHPKFQARLVGATRFAGVAIGTNECLVNLGNWRSSTHYEPWQISQTANHELNHMFLYQAGLTRSGEWTWFAEALAESIEDRVLPAARQQNLQTMKVFLKGYATQETWPQLVSDRNDDNLEQYRTYGDLLASIIYFLQSKYGADAIPRLLKNGKGRTLEQAFTATYGCGAQDLYKQWKEFYGIR